MSLRTPTADEPQIELRESTLAYQTSFGSMFRGDSASVLADRLSELANKVQLVFTSPPFPLNRKKRYDNKVGEEYLEWLASYAQLLTQVLVSNGSIVIEIGNAWESGDPVMSTLPLKSLLRFQESANLHLCQEFIVHNPARLPSPAQWVNVERCRVKDSFTHVWWMSPSPKPKADNKRILQPYSASMRQLLRTGKYNSGPRPSEHNIGEESFLKDNGGAIPSNVLTFTNTRATDDYLKFCKEHDLPIHPARMPVELPEFFVKFLTDEGDLVVDPFAGSNTTGLAAERLKRHWISIEMNEDYIKGSQARFSREPKLPIAGPDLFEGGL